MHTIKTGIVSYGYATKIFHMPFLDQHQGFEVKKIVQRHGNESKMDYPNIEVLSSFETLIEDETIELVIITTPNQLHYPMAKEALLKGKHVVIEKPFTITSEEANSLIELARVKQKLITVYQNRRLDSDFLTVKKILESGILGRVFEIESHFDRYRPELSNTKLWKEIGMPGCDILYDLGVHLIDQVYTLFGTPKGIYGDLRKLRADTQVFDYFDIHLDYDYTKVILKASVFVKENGPRWIIHGEKGSFIKYGMDIQEDQLTKGILPNEPIYGIERKENDGILNITDRKKYPTEKGKYGIFYDNLYDAIQGKTPLFVQPREAKKVIEIIELAIKSNEQKKKISLE